jgi:hypothetical protein
MVRLLRWLPRIFLNHHPAGSSSIVVAGAPANARHVTHRKILSGRSMKREPKRRGEQDQGERPEKTDPETGRASRDPN